MRTSFLPDIQWRCVMTHQNSVSPCILALIMERFADLGTARHISNLSTAHLPPVYMHTAHLPQAYMHTNSYQATSPFAGYSPELACLSHHSVPASHSTYWHHARDESVRLLSHGSPYVPTFAIFPVLR